MSEYISKDKIIEIITESSADLEYKSDNEELCNEIASIPPADVRENKHGYWIDTGAVFGNPMYHGYECSECGKAVYDTPYGIEEHHFCLHCGTSMDAEPEGEKGEA